MRRFALAPLVHTPRQTLPALSRFLAEHGLPTIPLNRRP
jgi:phosphatidate phosphatase APP1